MKSPYEQYLEREEYLRLQKLRSIIPYDNTKEEDRRAVMRMAGFREITIDRILGVEQ